MFSAINSFLDGKKSVLGVIGATGTLLVVVFNSLSDGFQVADLQVLIGAASAWLLAVGLTHKAIKIEDMLVAKK